MTFSSPVVAQSHYLGKTHAKNLKLKQQSTKVEGTGFPEWCYVSGPLPSSRHQCQVLPEMLTGATEVELLLRALKNIRVDPGSMKCILGVVLT